MQGSYKDFPLSRRSPAHRPSEASFDFKTHDCPVGFFAMFIPRIDDGLYLPSKVCLGSPSERVTRKVHILLIAPLDTPSLRSPPFHTPLFPPPSDCQTRSVIGRRDRPQLRGRRFLFPPLFLDPPDDPDQRTVPREVTSHRRN